MKVGFQVEFLRYFNLPQIFSWFVYGKIFRCKTLSPWSVWLYDRLVMSWIPSCERMWEPVLGQSVLAICTKPQKGK